jgi:hypothetical protein
MSASSASAAELRDFPEEKLRTFREAFSAIDQAGEGFIMRGGACRGGCGSPQTRGKRQRTGAEALRAKESRRYPHPLFAHHTLLSLSALFADVGTAMRALALHPSEADIKRLVDEVSPSGKVDFIGENGAGRES